MRGIRLGIYFAVMATSVICLAPSSAALSEKVSVQEYEKQLINQIDTAWRAAMNRNSGRLDSVAIEVHFQVNDDGGFDDIRVAAGRPNDRPDERLTRLTKKVLATIKAPPSPKDRPKRKPLEFNLRFEVLDSR